MSPDWTFSSHPAFADGVARGRQCAELGRIRAVLPLGAGIAAAWVWTAILDERAVPSALRALDEMPFESRVSVFSLSRVTL